jgi:hypothetical protein
MGVLPGKCDNRKLEINEFGALTMSGRQDRHEQVITRDKGQAVSFFVPSHRPDIARCGESLVDRPRLRIDYKECTTLCHAASMRS